MSQRAVVIRLKIPDNAAYTALVTLQRLNVVVQRVERSEILLLDDGGNPTALRERVERTQSLFNPNKHRLAIFEECEPRSGEVWIEEIAPREHEFRYVGWRLFDEANVPVARAVLLGALDALLCNPAIERALLRKERTA